jgi:hypothetical protein
VALTSYACSLLLFKQLDDFLYAPNVIRDARFHRRRQLTMPHSTTQPPPQIFKLTHYASPRSFSGRHQSGRAREYYRCDECGHVWMHEKANPNSPPEPVTLKAEKPHQSP